MENFITTLNKVHTKYVVLCDGDDYWTDINKLQKQYDFPQNIVPGDYYLHLIHAKDGKIKYLNQPMSVYRIQKEGMWYLTTQQKKQNEFYFLYGEKYYNFYKQVEIKLNKPDAFNDTQKWILKGYIKAIIKKREKDKLLNILKNEYDNNFKVISSVLKNVIYLINIFIIE